MVIHRSIYTLCVADFISSPRFESRGLLVVLLNSGRLILRHFNWAYATIVHVTKFRTMLAAFFYVLLKFLMDSGEKNVRKPSQTATNECHMKQW